MQKTLAIFDAEIRAFGYSIFPAVVPPELLVRLRADIPKREAVCRKVQARNGLTNGMEGAAHHVVGGGDSLEEFLYAFYLDEFIEYYFSGPYILNSYGALNNPPHSDQAYKHGLSFHRDVRTFAGEFRLMMNMLVMVDDFTIENGATRLVPGSHRLRERPSEDFLERHVIRATGGAGDIILFDSNMWHAAAANRTAKPRMALTLTFTRPFFKQQMDYPRMLGDSVPEDERIRQLLGYNSRVPTSYDEWYQPPERRMYKPGQG